MHAGRSASSPIALCLGVFDGVHRGHSAIINAARRFISGIPGGRTLALTFDPHPSRIVRPDSPQSLLQSLPSRVLALQKVGCDDVIVIPFTNHLANRSPDEFWSIIQSKVSGNILGIFAGQNWRFGAGRTGDLSQLARLSRSEGSIVIGVPPVLHLDKVISSTWIRDLVHLAAFDKIPALLGRFFELSGTVVMGQKLAGQWGYPTANLYPNQECLPQHGVYAGWTLIENKQPVWTVCNIGTRPSLGPLERQPLLEAHLLDFSENLYGHSIRFVPLHRIRAEQRFPSLEALRQQISSDVAEARRYLDHLSSGHDFICSSVT